MNPKEAKKADLSALENSISELFGWPYANLSNETALNATMRDGKSDSFKKSLELKPTLLKPYLYERCVAKVSKAGRFAEVLAVGIRSPEGRGSLQEISDCDYDKPIPA